jgi:hypothetical protein
MPFFMEQDMCYPKVKWLDEAKGALIAFLATNKPFTSLEFKNQLRKSFPKHDIRQKDVGEFLREVYRQNIMEGYVSVVEGNHLRYEPIKKTLWQRIVSLFR